MLSTPKPWPGGGVRWVRNTRTRWIRWRILRWSTRRRESSPQPRRSPEAVEADRKIRPDDWQRFFAESLLGASLAGEKKYDAAEPLLLEGYRGMNARKQKIGDPDRYHLDRAREWLEELYQAWGK